MTVSPELLNQAQAARAAWEASYRDLWHAWSPTDPELAQALLAHLGVDEAAAIWLATPNFFWEGAAPYEVLARGEAARAAVLHRVRQGWVA